MKSAQFLLLCLAVICGCDGAVSSTATAEVPSAADIDKLVAECTGCHKPSGPLDLSRNARSELHAKLEAIRAGKASHPTDMSKLTDAQLDTLAERLSKKK